MLVLGRVLGGSSHLVTSHPYKPWSSAIWKGSHNPRIWGTYDHHSCNHYFGFPDSWRVLAAIPPIPNLPTSLSGWSSTKNRPLGGLLRCNTATILAPKREGNHHRWEGQVVTYWKGQWVAYLQMMFLRWRWKRWPKISRTWRKRHVFFSKNWCFYCEYKGDILVNHQPQPLINYPSLTMRILGDVKKDNSLENVWKTW